MAVAGPRFAATVVNEQKLLQLPVEKRTDRREHELSKKPNRILVTEKKNESQERKNLN